MKWVISVGGWISWIHALETVSSLFRIDKENWMEVELRLSN